MTSIMAKAVLAKSFVVIACLAGSVLTGVCQGGVAAELPRGVRAVWDVEKAYRRSTLTRERICINGLWRWQPVDDNANTVPTENRGHFKVPGSWPGITDYVQKDCQTVYTHPSWKDQNLRSITAAWYQRQAWDAFVNEMWAKHRPVLKAPTDGWKKKHDDTYYRLAVAKP